MGQYYYPVNLDDKQYLLSHDYDNGLKLMEHSYINNSFMNAVERLIIPGGKWHMKRLVWAGDYADHEPGYEKTADGYDVNIHSIMSDEGTKIKPRSMRVVPSYRFLVNHSKKVFVDLLAIKADADNYKIHPLPLFVAEGNGRGGGDFHGEDDRIGTWARDVISLEETVPADVVEVSGQFNEES